MTGMMRKRPGPRRPRCRPKRRSYDNLLPLIYDLYGEQEIDAYTAANDRSEWGFCKVCDRQPTQKAQQKCG